jgi:hypothetical protein
MLRGSAVVAYLSWASGCGRVWWGVRGWQDSIKPPTTSIMRSVNSGIFWEGSQLLQPGRCSPSAP